MFEQNFTRKVKYNIKNGSSKKLFVSLEPLCVCEDLLPNENLRIEVKCRDGGEFEFDDFFDLEYQKEQVTVWFKYDLKLLGHFEVDLFINDIEVFSYNC